MAPLIIKSDDIDDDSKSWKTYYLKVTYQNEVFYKIGVCKGSVRQRYKKESSELSIDILKLWKHDNEKSAYQQEIDLFKQYPGDMPYIGRCGPFSFGGNTETYSHDVLAGEKPPFSYSAKLFTLTDINRVVTAYPERNPLLPFKHLQKQLYYMDTLWGPPDCGEGDYLQVPYLSSRSHVVLATEAYLADALLPERPSFRVLPKKHVKDIIERDIVIRFWSDYKKMRFEGSGFK